MTGAPPCFEIVSRSNGAISCWGLFELTISDARLADRAASCRRADNFSAAARAIEAGFVTGGAGFFGGIKRKVTGTVDSLL
jgi:hypothetical protein